MNGILIVNKPAGFTSHDVVAKLRGIYKTRRIGHSGTLDPMATGVLPILIGRATRACEFATGHDKIYRAELLLGMETDTQDITGRVLRACELDVSDAALLAAVASQVGDIAQIPPMYSAVKIGGKKLYQLARQGVEVERRPRPVTIYSIAVERLSARRAVLTVRASKGTYIRTLCADIGAKLGCGAVLTALERLCSGQFTLDMAHDFSEITRDPEGLLLPVDSLFLEYPALTVDAAGAKRARCGAEIPTDAPVGQTLRVYEEDGAFLMLATVVARPQGHCLRTVKSFFEVKS